MEDTNLLQIFFPLIHVIVPRWNAELSIISIKGWELRCHNNLIRVRNHRAIHCCHLCPTAMLKLFSRVNIWTEQPLFPLDTWTASVGEVPALQCHLWWCLPVALFNSSPVRSRTLFLTVKWWRGSGRLVLNLASIHVEKGVVWQGTTASSPPPFPVYRQD